MNVFSAITLLGGLAFFLYGMKVMSDGLEKSANGKLNKNLDKITRNRFLAMLFGACMTVAVQSSSAVTVMLVGLVNSGILHFGQTIGVLMGSNIGTTLTAWILSLAGIDSDVFWLKILKPANFAPLFAFIGIIITMLSKNEKRKSTGNVLVGFAILMFGMTLMSDAMEPLSEMPEFSSILTAFKNPLLAVLVGAIFTGIIQSSAASVGILQALSLSGEITYGIAIPIIMGQNIGTCVTALISSIGVNRNAKKVAVVHLTFNILGTLICLIPFYIGNMIFDWAFVDMEITPIMIAIIHTLFNVFTTAILLPFAKHLEKIANFIIKDKDQPAQQKVLLDERILSIPAIAVEKAFDLSIEMCFLAKQTFLKATSQTFSFDDKIAEDVYEHENELDHLEDHLSTYMMRLSKIGISEEDSKCVAKILHTVDDFERIGDHAINYVQTTKDMLENKQVFSEDAAYEVSRLNKAIADILEITATAYKNNDPVLAAKVEPFGEAINDLILKAKRNHIKRLQKGVCTKDTGFTFNDILTNLERVSDHCSNIAVATIESRHGTFDTHEYLQEVKGHPTENFQQLYTMYLNEYSLVPVSAENKED